jgi:hypothetical protein
MSTCIVRLERHRLGPRLYLLGRRAHEYQVGLATVAASLALTAPSLPHPSLGSVAMAVGGLWLVIKDWPDLFPATRDKASWSLGIHRLPPEEA